MPFRAMLSLDDGVSGGALGMVSTGGFTGLNYESTPIENVSVMAGTSEWTAERHGLRDGQEVWLEGTVPAAEPVF